MTKSTKELFHGTRLNLTGPLMVEILPNGRGARLIQPYRVGTAAGRIIDVPQGFETDFASVPRLFWRIVPPWGRAQGRRLQKSGMRNAGLEMV